MVRLRRGASNQSSRLQTNPHHTTPHISTLAGQPHHTTPHISTLAGQPRTTPHQTSPLTIPLDPRYLFVADAQENALRVAVFAHAALPLLHRPVCEGEGEEQGHGVALGKGIGTG